MSVYTACYITLVGMVAEKPEIAMDNDGNLVAHLLITSNPITYGVFVLGDAALRVRQYAIPQARLWIEGNLQIQQQKHCVVLAQKIAFLNDAEPNTSQTDSPKTVVIEQLHPNEFLFVESEAECGEWKTRQ